MFAAFYGVLWALFLQGTAECLAAICGGVIDGKYLHQAGGRCVVIPRAAVDGTMCGLLWRVGKAGGIRSDVSDVGGDGDLITGSAGDRVGHQDAVGVAHVGRQSVIDDQRRCDSVALDFIYGCQ